MPQAKHKDFHSSISDLIETPVVRSMHRYTQHAEVSCLEHCIFVSYLSFRLCRFMGFDEIAAARGGLLHDLFLYDWHKTSNRKGLHGFHHAATALENAEANFILTARERDIIEKHMWPLTLRRIPKYREAFIVCLVDKFCTLAETSRLYCVLGFGRKFPYRLAHAEQIKKDG